MTEKQGTVTDVIYHNRGNGYTVAVVETEEEEFTAVGFLPSCDEGRSYVFRGEFTVDKKYGEQFAFRESEEVMPSDEAGMIGFLSSGVLKGIGPKAARAIVKKFGEDTFKIIEEEPGKLTRVSGIGEKKAAAISEAYIKNMEFAKVSMFFQKYNISAAQSLKLYKAYGAFAVDIVKTDPYQLANDIDGIGFQKADAIAMKMGIDKESEERIRGGIKFMLWHYTNQGNTCCPETEFCEETGRMLEVSRDLVAENLIPAAFEGEIKIENIQGRRMVYLFSYYAAEQSVAKNIAKLNSFALTPLGSDADGLISQTEKETGITFSGEQKEAIKSSLSNGVSVITGGPGTGKTTIINGIIKILTQNGLKVSVAAPTGRAAKRITETTGYPASTIHRLLEYYFSEGEGIMRFGKTEEDPLDCDAVIVDEASMIDLMLMDGLCSAVRIGTRLIIVGDADQLPSVGAGNVLRDIIDSEYVYSVRLKEIFRQAEESLIVVNAHRINGGEYPACNEDGKDFFMMRRGKVPEMVDTILELCGKRLPAYYEQCDPVKDIQVLTPRRQGPLGCGELNKRLQETLNPPAPELAEKTYGDKLFREGDKVMQIKNNYSMKWKKAGEFTEGEGVFNGDVGFIETINKEHGEITVVYDEDKYVTYNNDDLDELEVAYAVTVHKSQGSEFPIMVMPVSWFPPVLATRNLLYTAVTRGKEAVVLVGSENRLHDMVDNNSITERYSGLAERLRALL
ncbi:MAG: ATP-dependent RecD-like DNA helicase [Eubacteriaceae bacterium]|nr:ATP-dependent RecD-like DNA helicase [Eubacteriaceae bacterium]